MRVGLALPDDGERDMVAAWLRGEDMQPEALAGGATIQSDAAGRCLDCVVVDVRLIAQGYWSSLRRHDARLPIVAVADAGANVPAAVRRAVNVLERPLAAHAVTLAVALAHGEGRQARRRTRQPAGGFPVRVGGAPADILDVSDEGLRLEIDPAFAARLGPTFQLQVSMVALDVTVRRAWVGRGRGDRVQCGARLISPSLLQQQAWARVVDLAGSAGAVTPVAAPGRPATPHAPRSVSDRVSAMLAASPLVGAFTSRFLRSGA